MTTVIDGNRALLDSSQNSYGTVNNSDMSGSNDSSWFIYRRLSRDELYHRWFETFVFIPCLFLSNVLWELAVVFTNFSNSWLASFYVALAAALGAFVGYFFRIPFLKQTPKVDMVAEIDEALAFALSIFLGPASMIIQLYTWSKDLHFNPPAYYSSLLFLNIILFMGMRGIVRGTISWVKTGNFKSGRGSFSFLHDLTLSITLGVAYTFLAMGFTNGLGDEAANFNQTSWLETIFAVSSLFGKMILAGVIFILGYLLAQTLENLTLPHTWTDDIYD